MWSVTSKYEGKLSSFISQGDIGIIKPHPRFTAHVLATLSHNQNLHVTLSVFTTFILRKEKEKKISISPLDATAQFLMEKKKSIL